MWTRFWRRSGPALLVSVGYTDPGNWATDIAAGSKLACRARYGRRPNTVLWLMAELAIIVTDLAEALGSALALHRLFGLSLLVGIVITAFDMLLVVGLQGRGFRQVSAPP